MVSRFMNCLGFRHFLPNIFLYVLSVAIAHFFLSFGIKIWLILLVIFFSLLIQFSCVLLFLLSPECFFFIVVVAFVSFILFVFTIISQEMFVNLSLKFD